MPTANVVSSLSGPGRLTTAREVFRLVVGFPNYEVSSFGTIRNAKTGKTKAQHANKKGYKATDLWRSGQGTQRRIHTLVLLSFVGPAPRGYECDHIDGNRANNHVGNLEWVTRSENQRRRFIRHGADIFGSRHWNAKANEKLVRCIRFAYAKDPRINQSLIGRAVGISSSAMNDIVHGRRWKSVA